MIDSEKTLSGEQFARLRRYQDNGCALCGEVRNDLVLDHDHKTMLVRGLLCTNCNHLLGDYERRKRLFAHFEAYLAEPPMKALGLAVLYKPAKVKERAS